MGKAPTDLVTGLLGFALTDTLLGMLLTICKESAFAQQCISLVRACCVAICSSHCTWEPGSGALRAD